MAGFLWLMSIPTTCSLCSCRTTGCTWWNRSPNSARTISASRDHLDPLRWLAQVLPDVAVVYLHTILPDDLTERLPPVTQNWRDFVSNDDWRERLARGQNSDRSESAATFIEQIEAEPNSARPAFHFLHVLLPHEPWVYLPTGQRFSASGAVAGFGGRLPGCGWTIGRRSHSTINATSCKSAWSMPYWVAWWSDCATSDCMRRR